MTAEVRFDTSDVLNLSRAIAGLPGEIKAKAMARAMRRMRDMARTRIVKRSSEHTKLPAGVVRKLTTARFNAGGNTQDVVVKSGWIHLYSLGATQTSQGVRVRGRGSFRSAFLAEMGSGHRGVMMRTGKGRLPIRELFGPNPAHAITNNPEVYLDVLAELIEENLAPRILHEIDNLLRR